MQRESAVENKDVGRAPAANGKLGSACIAEERAIRGSCLIALKRTYNTRTQKSESTALEGSRVTGRYFTNLWTHMGTTEHWSSFRKQVSGMDFDQVIWLKYTCGNQHGPIRAKQKRNGAPTKEGVKRAATQFCNGGSHLTAVKRAQAAAQAAAQKQAQPEPQPQATPEATSKATPKHAPKATPKAQPPPVSAYSGHNLAGSGQIFFGRPPVPDGPPPVCVSPPVPPLMPEFDYAARAAALWAADTTEQEADAHVAHVTEQVDLLPAEQEQVQPAAEKATGTAAAPFGLFGGLAFGEGYAHAADRSY